jgi:hypothetical protein
MVRNRIVSTVLAASVAASAAGGAVTAHHRVTHRPAACSAHVILWEDGSWMGSTLEVRGRVISQRWEVTGPESRGMHRDATGQASYGVPFPVTLTNGTRCTIVTGK